MSNSDGVGRSGVGLPGAIAHWIAHDPDPATAAQLQELFDAAQAGDSASAAQLRDSFKSPLAFGTAGLRGPVTAGPGGMNRATVIRATAGLVAHLRELVGAQPRVVIGCDARHGSAQFQRDTAAVVAAAGGEALALPAQVPTPVTAFAVRHLGADAGIMITASHNPALDNGYKVYLGGRAVNTDERRGVQIIPPHDAQITAHIDAAPPADQVPRDPEAVQALGPEVEEAYLARLAELPLVSEKDQRAELSIVVTPMHGVGGKTLLQALNQAGFTHVSPVADQFEPDPDFPTVAYPNPEEPGALDLALDHARAINADLVLAVDPDADRCCAAVPTPGGCTSLGCAPRDWRVFTGDETGAILGERIAAQTPPATLATSIVSSRLLERIAAAHGHNFRTTLTGFKWISGVEGLAFGYEEALGYCVDPAAVRDKDGISAALLLADALATTGSLTAALESIFAAHGAFKTAPLTLRMPPEQAEAQVLGILEQPPTELAGAQVTATHDLSEGLELTDLRGQSYRLPPTPGALIYTEANDRVILRPSGTEPKLKCYLEAIADTEAHAQARVQCLRQDLERLL